MSCLTGNAALQPPEAGRQHGPARSGSAADATFTRHPLQEDCSSAASELLSCTDWDLGLLRTALGWLHRPPLTPPAAGPLPPAGRRAGKGKRAAQQGGGQFPEDTRRRWYGNGSGRWRWPRCIRRPCRLASRHPSQSKHVPAQPTLANLSLLSSNSFCSAATYCAWYLSTLHSPPGKHDQRW